MHRPRRSAYAGALGLIVLGLSTSSALAGSSLVEAVRDGKFLVDMRLRHENVHDKNCVPCAGRDADAETLRARVGYETGKWDGLSALAEFDLVGAFSPQRYNSKVNGHTTFPVIADPELIALNRLQVSYDGPLQTNLVLGRQRILLDDQRFVGNSGWRQHEQTFDALSVVNTSLPDTKITYAYLMAVNRVYGPDSHTLPTIGRYNSASHLINAAFTGIPHLKLDGFAYLLDFKEAPTASTATFGARAEAKFALQDDLAAQFNASFAHQSDYAHNPNSVDLNYWLAEGSVAYEGLTGTLGNAAMGGNGVVGFATPLSTLHKFNGWAELFLTTPKNGIDDLYASASYAIKGLPWIVSVTPTVVYHQFHTDRGNTDIGNEWDMAADVAVDKNFSANVTYATYLGAGVGLGGFKDKSITWVSAAFKL